MAKQTNNKKNDLTQARQLIKECHESQNPYLDLGNCGITDLNDLPELFECTHLETLILSNEWWDYKEKNFFSSNNEGANNKLIAIPLQIGKLIKLKNLIFAGDWRKPYEISDISSLEKLTNLQTLNLCNNQISDISFLDKLTALQSLNLSANQITDISCLEKLTALQTLYLSSNQISDISSLEKLTSLKSLNLSRNNISDISFIVKLTSLQSLDLSSNKISVISFLEKLTSLKYLDLSSNQISFYSFLSSLTSLQYLKLRNNNISDISFIVKLTSLQSLDLSSNQISDYSILSKLTALQSLNLSFNQISDISFLEKLTSLQSLDLSYNQISDIKVLTCLTSLKSLNLSSNHISDISLIANLTLLQSLYLSTNNISETSFLSALKDLTTLSLIFNQISDISSLVKLTALHSLDLRYNQIKIIPFSILNLNMEISMQENGSEGLGLYNNPIESPPLEIIEQGRQSVLDWFEAKKKKLNEIKIILIGDPKAGKTSLLRMLKDGSFDENEVQTDGVNIEDIQFKECKTFEKQKNLHHLTGHFWDFGGQEIMNATHQFFLTKRSVYILVLDARKDLNNANQIRQWAKQIKATGGNSALIVVANQIDVNKAFGFENEYDLKKEFPQIKYFIKASCKTGEGIELIKEKLAELIPQAELLNTEIDEKWIDIKEILQQETKQKYFLNENKFLNICDTYQLNEKSKQQNAINFLNDLGLVLHFEESKLSEYYVLNPYWITYGVYQILTSSYAGENKGIVGMDKLSFIINEEEEKKQTYSPANYKKIYYSPNERRFLIEILHLFKLCFCLPDGCKFIIPDLLDTKEPEQITAGIRNNHNGLQLVYDYDYLPKSVMPNFMVETHHLIKEMWRTGCILEYNDCKALITNYRNRISVIVTGDYKKKRDFLSVIRYQLDLINQKLSDKPHLLIPLAGTDEFADYEELLEREKEGEKIYKIYKPIKMEFEISKLLEGIKSKHEIMLLQKKLDEILAKQDNLKELMSCGFNQVNDRLDEHYHYLIKQTPNKELIKEITSLIAETTEAQKNEIVGDMIDFIDSYDKEMDKKLEAILIEIKKSDNLDMKLKLSVPFINQLGIDIGIETKFDVKKWAEQKYEKYKLPIFKLMGVV